MRKEFKLKAGSPKLLPHEPMMGITGTGKDTFLWIGNNAAGDKFCFATLSGPATLRKFAHQIIEALDDWKPVSGE